MPSSNRPEEAKDIPLPSLEGVARLLREQEEELRDLARATLAAEKHERAHPRAGG